MECNIFFNIKNNTGLFKLKIGKLLYTYNNLINSKRVVSNLVEEKKEKEKQFQQEPVSRK